MEQLNFLDCVVTEEDTDVSTSSDTSILEALLLECPICLKGFNEVDPTTFPCGHSCCINDAKDLKVCCICNAELSMQSNYKVSITLRDISHRLLNRKRKNSK